MEEVPQSMKFVTNEVLYLTCTRRGLDHNDRDCCNLPAIAPADLQHQISAPSSLASHGYRTTVGDALDSMYCLPTTSAPPDEQELLQ
jgi:hypothetical protein